MKITGISVERLYSTVCCDSELLHNVGLIAGVTHGSANDVFACKKRALSCIEWGHHSVFEHILVTLRCVVDRGTSHAIVRHRHCAFTQQSTIYSKDTELTIVPSRQLTTDELSMYKDIEHTYVSLLDKGVSPAQARDVLPTCTATTLIITTSIREWMYIMHRRTGKGDSDSMHEWARQVRILFEDWIPQTVKAFDAWYEKHPL
jgi:thymidylate synthase (FAD)